MIRKWFWVVLLWGGCAAGQLHAGDATLYLGFQKAGKLTLTNSPEVISRAISGDTNWGGVFGARISGGRILGFEQSLGYSPSFLETGLKSLNAQSNLVLNVPLYHVTPYATAGVGVITNWGDSLRDFGTKLTVNYGGGVKLKNLAGPVGLRFDLRGYSVPNAFKQNLFFAKQSVNFIEGTIGVFFSF